VEIAMNRAKTTLAYNGQYISDWPDGGIHPDNMVGSHIFQRRFIGSFLCRLPEYPNMHYYT